MPEEEVKVVRYCIVRGVIQQVDRDSVEHSGEIGGGGTPCAYSVDLVASSNPKCPDEVITLSAEVTQDPPSSVSRSTSAEAAFSFSWSTGETTQSIEVSDAGTYKVTVTREGCDVPKMASVDVEQKSAEDEPGCKLIKNAFWCDESGEETSKLPFGQTTLRMCVEFDEEADGKMVSIKVRRGFNEILQTEKVAAVGLQSYSFELTGALFAMGGSDNVQDWWFDIDIDGKKFSSATYSDLMKLFVIRFIPEIMDANAMTNGAALMRKWFTGSGEDCTDQIKLSWLLSAPQYRPAYDLLVDSCLNEPGQNLIRMRLQNMIDDGYISLPPPGDSVFIALLDRRNYRDLERYYTNSREYDDEFAIMTEPLDDHLAAIGLCNFRCASQGWLKRIVSTDMYTFSISEVGQYMEDSYDFNRRIEPLGSWNPVTNGVSKFNLLPNWYQVGNGDFRAWREHHGSGTDFTVFSDIRKMSANVIIKDIMLRN